MIDDVPGSAGNPTIFHEVLDIRRYSSICRIFDDIPRSAGKSAFFLGLVGFSMAFQDLLDIR